MVHSTAMETSRFKTRLPLLALVLVGLTAWKAMQLGLLDDAYISFRYAFNLLQGHGLSFNPGQVVEGYSNFLWVMFSTGWIAAGLDPVAASKVTGLVCVFFTALLIVLYLREESPLAAALASAAYLLCPVTIRASTNGLETSLFGLLLTLGFYLGRKRPLAASIVFALSALTRFEGGLFFAIWWTATLLLPQSEGERSFKRTIRSGLLFSAIFVPYFLWRWNYFDSFLPNTFYVKKAPLLSDIPLGLQYLWYFIQDYPVFLLAFLRWKKHASPVYLSFVLFTLYIVWVGGDSFDNFRFFAPVIPLCVILIFQHILWLGQKLRPALYGLVVFYLAFTFIQFDTPKHPARSLGVKCLLGVSQPGQSIATPTIGKIGWLGRDQIIIDTLGLTDPVIAHGDADPRIRIKGHEKHNPDHVLMQKPDFFLPIGKVVQPGPEHYFEFYGVPFDSDIINHPSFARQYKLAWCQVGERRIHFFARRPDNQGHPVKGGHSSTTPVVP